MNEWIILAGELKQTQTSMRYYVESANNNNVNIADVCRSYKSEQREGKRMGASKNDCWTGGDGSRREEEHFFLMLTIIFRPANWTNQITHGAEL